MHAWHDIELGERIEQHFRVVIEIPEGSQVKSKLDKGTGLLAIARVLTSTVHYVPKSPQAVGKSIDVQAA